MEYLKVWTSFREVMAPLGDAEKGRLFDAMLTYAETGEEPSEFKGNERFLWIVAKQDIDRTAQKCENLRANASKGGLAKGRNLQEKANDSKSKQIIANDSKQEQIVTNDNKPEKAKRFIPPTVEEVRCYCIQRKNHVDPEQFVAFYAAKGWKIGQNAMKDWKQAVITWEKRDREKAGTPAQKTVSAQQYSQRDYEEAPTKTPEQLLAELRDCV